MIAEQFKAARLALGLSQEMCAKMLGVSRITVIRYEKGQTAIAAGIPDRLAKLQPVAKADKHKVAYPGHVAPRTHPHLYVGSPRAKHGKGEWSRAPEHPCELLPDMPWPVFEEGGMPQAPVWVLEHSKYTEALAKRRAAPPAPKLSDDEFAAKILAGASLDELFKK